ncbi:MAG: hypothetical protein P3W90_000540 [Paracoccus sp. (in: a-proteobacteria)]|nr:hypothetical protein [Paracoccus sp. (in: a-proteobacteria)]
MALKAEHEIHRRRSGRNIGLGLVLVAFVALVFGLTVVKVQNGDSMQGYDHRPRPSMLPKDPNPVPRNPAPVAAPGTPAAEQAATPEASQ